MHFQDIAVIVSTAAVFEEEKFFRATNSKKLFFAKIFLNKIAKGPVVAPNSSNNSCPKKSAASPLGRARPLWEEHASPLGRAHLIVRTRLL